MQDESLRRYERELARAGFGTPRDVAAALLRSTPSRYWLVCGPSYPFPGALWNGSAWWPKEGPAGNANLPFPVTGWARVTYRFGMENGAVQGPSEALQGAHLVAYRVVGIEEAEALKAPFEAHGWSLRLWDAVSQKQVASYGFSTLDAVEDGWVSLADRSWGLTGWASSMPPMSAFAAEHERQLATLDERIRRVFGPDSPSLPSMPVTVDPPLTVRVGEAVTHLRLDPPPAASCQCPTGAFHAAGCPLEGSPML